MIRKVQNYITTVDHNTQCVADALSRGAFPTAEEAYDFLFKSLVCGYHSKARSKYEVMYPEMSLMASTESFVLECIMESTIKGFTGNKARRMIKEICSRFNRLLPFLEKLSFESEDSDGILTFTVVSTKNEISAEIRDRASLCKFLSDVWELGNEALDVFPAGISEYITAHLVSEVDIIISGKPVEPVLGGSEYGTLRHILLNKTDYASQRKAQKPVALVPKCTSVV
jgi:hypothetical protein